MWKFTRSKRKTRWTMLREQLEVAEFLGSVKQRLIDAGGCIDHVEEIVAGEHEIALETILVNLDECYIQLSEQEFECAKELAKRLGLQPSYWEHLKEQNHG